MPLSLMLTLNREEEYWLWDMVNRTSGQQRAITRKIRTPNPIRPAEIISSLNQIFSHNHSTITIPSLKDKLREWGNEIWHRVFPHRIKNVIERAEEGDIFFRLPPEWADIPFELCYISSKDKFLGHIFQIGTVIILQPEEDGEEEGDSQKQPHLDKMLIIADLIGNLSYAHHEGMELKKLADKYKIDRTVINRPLTTDVLLDHLRIHHVVHFAGHSHDTGNPDSTGWEINKNKLFNLHDIGKLRKGLSVPWLIFSNSCDAGMCGCDAHLHGIAGTFLKAGISQVIAPFKKVNDGEALKFAKYFYNNLFDGNPPSSSLLHAKKKVFEENPDSVTPLLYRLSGDPRFGVKDGIYKPPPRKRNKGNNALPRVIKALTIVLVVSIIVYFRTITILVSLAPDEYEFFKKTIVEFGLKKLYIPITKNVSSEEILTSLHEKRKIDIVMLDINRRGDILVEEELEDLTHYPDFYQRCKSTIMTKVEELLNSNNERQGYFIPFRLTVKLLFVNRQKIDQILSDSHRLLADWTYQELMQCAKALKEQQGIERVIIPAYERDAPLFLLELIWAVGGDPVNFLDESSMKAIDFLQNLLCYIKLGNWQITNSSLIMGSVYIAPQWSFGRRDLEKASIFNNFTVYPGLTWAKNSIPHNLLGGDFLAIPKNASHKRSARKFIELLLSPEIQEKIAKKLYWVPINSIILTQLAHNNHYFQKLNDALVNAKPVPSCWNTCVTDVYFDLFKTLQKSPASPPTIDKKFLHPYQEKLKECFL
ncbi:MAG: extracellular solute-binding protein [bacterium]